MTSTNAVRPQQGRSRQTQARILTAVEQILREGSFREATVQEICLRAGCSVGAFYGRFSDKTSAFHTFHETMCERTRVFARQCLDRDRWSKITLAEILTRYVRLLVRNYLKNRRLLRAGLLFADETGSREFSERAARVERDGNRMLLALFEQRRHEVKRDPARSAARFIRLVRAMLVTEVLMGTARPDEDELIETISSMALEVAGVEAR